MQEDNALVGIDLKGPVDQHFLFTFRIAAPGQCIDAGDQFSRPCRFGDIVVGAGIQGANDVGFTVTLGQENGGYGPVKLCPDVLQYLDAGHVRNLPVQNNQIITAVQNGTEKRLAGRKAVTVMSFL